MHRHALRSRELQILHLVRTRHRPVREHRRPLRPRVRLPVRQLRRERHPHQPRFSQSQRLEVQRHPQSRVRAPPRQTLLPLRHLQPLVLPRRVDRDEIGIKPPFHGLDSQFGPVRLRLQREGRLHLLVIHPVDLRRQRRRHRRRLHMQQILHRLSRPRQRHCRPARQFRAQPQLARILPLRCRNLRVRLVATLQPVDPRRQARRDHRRTVPRLLRVDIAPRPRNHRVHLSRRPRRVGPDRRHLPRHNVVECQIQIPQRHPVIPLQPLALNHELPRRRFVRIQHHLGMVAETDLPRIPRRRHRIQERPVDRRVLAAVQRHQIGVFDVKLQRQPPKTKVRQVLQPRVLVEVVRVPQRQHREVRGIPKDPAHREPLLRC